MDVFRSVMEAAQIPPDTLRYIPYLQLYGNQKICLQNEIRLIDYDSTHLLLQGKTCKIEICGSCFEIQQYTKQELILRGKIKTVHFL